VNRRNIMTGRTVLTRKWLRKLLRGLGTSADEVVATLRAAGVTGTRTDAHDCPGAGYITLKAREILPATDRVTVTLTADKAVIAITRADTSYYRDIKARTPEALEDFLDGFDSGDYADLRFPRFLGDFRSWSVDRGVGESRGSTTEVPG
jgi:hypothetical protein